MYPVHVWFRVRMKKCCAQEVGVCILVSILQTEAQKKKDEAEVQVNSLCTRGGREGTLVQVVGLYASCLEFVSVDLELPSPRPALRAYYPPCS
jgi:hypothetical protein